MIYSIQRVLKIFYGPTIELWIAVDMNKGTFLEIHTSGIKNEAFSKSLLIFSALNSQIIDFNSWIEREKWE